MKTRPLVARFLASGVLLLACWGVYDLGRRAFMHLNPPASTCESMLTQENAIKHHYVSCLQRELKVHDVDEVCDKYIDPFHNPWLAR